MLESVSSLKSQLEALPESDSSIVAATNFIGVVATFSNAVQAGSEGTVGIFLYNNATAIPLIASLPPVDDNSWIVNFADAIEAGVITGVITPGTVTDPAWAGGSDTDTSTSPSPSSTITTLASAKQRSLRILQMLPTAIIRRCP